MLGGVLFPYFSKIQDDTLRLAQLFIGNTRLVYALIWPITFGFVALGDEFIAMFYGERWLPMVAIASVAIFLGLSRTFEYLSNSLLMATGHPDISTRSLAIQIVITFALIIPFVTRFHAVGVVIAILLGSMLAQTAVCHTLRKELAVSTRKLLNAILFAFAPSFFMLIIIQIFTYVTDWGYGATLFAGVMLGGLVYATTLFAFDFLTGKRIIQSLVWLKRHA